MLFTQIKQRTYFELLFVSALWHVLNDHTSFVRFFLSSACTLSFVDNIVNFIVFIVENGDK